MFSKEGEINDAELIPKYSIEFRDYFYSVGSTFNDPAFKNFAFVTEDSLWNLSTTPVGELNKFVLISSSANSVSFAADKFNNLLDGTGTWKPGANDTLLIRQFDVALLKEK